MSDVIKSVGRPAGKTKTSKIEIAIEPEIKEQFMQILQAEGKKASIELCLWIREFIKEHNRGQEK